MIANNIQRSFVLGDEWVYFKIYLNPVESNRVLLNAICPLKDKLLNENIVDKWFYLRYGDPEYHLRIRFHLVRKDLLGVLTNLFNDSIKDDIRKKIIWRVQADTYNREIERYGGESAMEFSESVFFIHSEIVLYQLKKLRVDSIEEKRTWIPIVFMIDDLLNVFKFSISEKCDQFEYLSLLFLNEFGYNSKDKKYLSSKYREVRKYIYDVLNGNIFIQDCLFIQKKNKDIQCLLCKYMLEKSTLTYSTISSYIHMLVNRYFDNYPRAHELVIYYILWSYYKSVIARNAKIIG